MAFCHFGPHSDKTTTYQDVVELIFPSETFWGLAFRLRKTTQNYRDWSKTSSPRRLIRANEWLAYRVSVERVFCSKSATFGSTAGSPSANPAVI